MSDAVDFTFMGEQLRAIRSSQSRTEERLDRIERRLGTVEDYMASIVKTNMQHEGEFYSLEARVARIERRLELTNGGEG